MEASSRAEACSDMPDGQRSILNKDKNIRTENYNKYRNDEDENDDHYFQKQSMKYVTIEFKSLSYIYLQNLPRTHYSCVYH